MNKIGINYTEFEGLSLEDCFEIISNAGFDCIFTGYWGRSKNIQECKKLADKYTLKYECVHAPFKTINSLWQKGIKGEKTLFEIQKCIKECGENLVPYVVLHLSSGENPPLINELGVRRFEKIIDTAKKYNVTVAFENQRKFSNLSYIFELFGKEKNVAFCWDVGHEKCFTGGKEFMPLFADKLVYTHIHDNTCEHNKDLHLLPFDGKIDYTRTVQHLKKANFKGTLTLEVIPEISKAYQDVDAKEYYKRAFSAAKKLQSMMQE